MSKRIKDLEHRILILENQRDRVRKRLLKMERVCHKVGATLVKQRGVHRSAGRMLWSIATDLEHINHEYDKYTIHKED